MKRSVETVDETVEVTGWLSMKPTLPQQAVASHCVEQHVVWQQAAACSNEPEAHLAVVDITACGPRVRVLVGVTACYHV